jgi:hypothetical protein
MNIDSARAHFASFHYPSHGRLACVTKRARFSVMSRLQSPAEAGAELIKLTSIRGWRAARLPPATTDRHWLTDQVTTDH